METIETFGYKIEPLEDGSVQITTPEGNTLILDKDRTAQINLQNISKVGFENITDLKKPLNFAIS